MGIKEIRKELEAEGYPTEEEMQKILAKAKEIGAFVLTGIGDEKEGQFKIAGVGSAMSKVEMIAAVIEDTAEQLSEGYSKMIREEYSEMIGEAYNEESEEQVKEFMYMILGELEERVAETKREARDLA